MMLEIGSEFWSADGAESERLFFLSGRTALEHIIRDIKANWNIKSAVVPSWCCHTMIEPFLRQGIQVRFFDIFYDYQNGLCAEKPEVRQNEIFYYMTYFGFEGLNGLSLEEIVGKWDCIVSDETHSWLRVGGQGETLCAETAGPDYRYTSYRKWTGVYGIASAMKAKGRFVVRPEYRLNEAYFNMRKNAAGLKQKYMEGSISDKQGYLQQFNRAEKLLEADYVGYAPCVEAIEQLINLDRKRLVHRRRENARYLIEHLAGFTATELLFDELGAQEVPLFVPILTAEGDRDGLRRWLIENRIYCPVHWPLSDYHKGISHRAREIYGRELSLPCDQRYTLDDMKTIVQAVERYYYKSKRDTAGVGGNLNG